MHMHRGVKYQWILPEAGDDLIELASESKFSYPLAQVLYSRGLRSADAIDAFLFCSFEKNVFHPSLLKDAHKAVDRIFKAIDKQEKILIVGDYDVDGVSSSALLMHSLTQLGAKVNFFVPNRVRDGYGISRSVVERAARSGYTLIITVDNGITAFDAVAQAKQWNIDLIITDHHQQQEQVPDAFAVINPAQDSCTYPFKKLAGVGVAFKLAALLYEQKGLEIPDKVYELLLLGTVADVVPLVGENRFWVRYCLQQINAKLSHPLKVLKQNSRIEKPILSALDIGFFLAPQINALGRLEDARQGVRFLISQDNKEIESVGRLLFELNEARKEVERSIAAQVEREIQSGRIDPTRENIIMAASSQWPSGVIGLVASRMVNMYGKPTLLFHLGQDGIVKGSCRSIPGFNIFDALQSSKDLLLHFGGHAQAAGLSLRQENLTVLKERLENLVVQTLTPFDLQQKITIDALLSLSELNKKFIRDLSYFEPFGCENPEPVFMVKQASLVQEPTLLKDQHVKCKVFADGVIKSVIFFNRPELIEPLRAVGADPFDLAVKVVENYWNGTVNVELVGIDLAVDK